MIVMSEIRLAVIGMGSVRYAPALVGSLANYFGERPLEIRFYDADEERLDLFDRLARALFLYSKVPHRLISTSDHMEALDGVTAVILALDDNCARKHLGALSRDLEPEARIAQALSDLLADIPEDVEILSLMLRNIPMPVNRYWRNEWPEEPSEAQSQAVPHEALRYINGEEPLWQFLQPYERTPIRAWLDDPMSAEFVAE